MTMISNPNWFSVLSATFILGGFCLAAKAALLDPSRTAERKVDLGLGLPLLILGGVFNVLGTVSTLTSGTIAASLMLGLAYMLLLYAGFYELAVERMSSGQSVVERAAPKLAVVKAVTPQLPSPEVADTRPLVQAKDVQAKEAAAQL